MSCSFVAAHSTRAAQRNKSYKTFIVNGELENHYRLLIRYYIHFNSIKFVTSDLVLKSYAPVTRCYCYSLIFPVKGGSIEETALKKFNEALKSDLWKVKKEVAISEYIEDFQRHNSNVLMDRNYVDISEQFIYEVETDD